MRIAVEQVRLTALRALLAVGAERGLSSAHAALQVDLLLDAQMRGVPSHGLLRLPRVIERIGNGIADPGATGVHTWRGSHLLHVDGRQGLGPVVAQTALDAIIERSRESGVAVAAIADSNHLGMLAWYARAVAARGFVLLAMTTSEALVHPWGGRHAMLGTNPLAIGVPATPHPFVVDMATSLVSMGKIHDHANRGLPIPQGWALDAQGNPTTDAQAAKRGAIAPFGGAKGYALGLAIEVLVAGLTGSALGTAVQGTLDSTSACNKGDVFIVLNPGAATHTDNGANAGAGAAIASTVSSYLDAIRESPPENPDAPVSVPGDRAERSHAAALADGVEIDAALWQQIQTLSEPHIGRQNT